MTDSAEASTKRRRQKWFTGTFDLPRFLHEDAGESAVGIVMLFEIHR